MKVVKNFFADFPDDIPTPNLETWYEDQQGLYRKYEKIYRKYHPKGTPRPQAYLGVRE